MAPSHPEPIVVNGSPVRLKTGNLVADAERILPRRYPHDDLAASRRRRAVRTR